MAPTKPAPKRRPAPGADAHSRRIRQDDLAARLGVSKPTFLRQKREGKVGPQPIIFGRSVGYLLAEVVAWLSHRKPTGELHDAKSWPAVWAELQREVSHAAG